MQKIDNLCSLNPKDSWYVSDVTKNSSCVCPCNQTKISKKLGDDTIFKCELTQNLNNPVVIANAVDASSSRNLSNPNNLNNLNNPVTKNSSIQNVYNPLTQNPQVTQPNQINQNSQLNINNPNPSFNTAICDETPHTSNPDNWVGLSTDSTCNCPNPLTQKNTKINDKTYFTCSWPVVQQ